MEAEIEIKGHLNYPEHEHPHGIKDLQPNENRIWVCEECRCIFNDDEIREDIKKDWGHGCLRFHGTRCESHLEPYVPELVDKNG
jgi:hypothetical protein